MTRPPRPVLFTLLALWFGFRAVTRFGRLLGTTPDALDPGAFLLRFVTACAIVACGVSAVALWRVKPWAHHPVAAWVAAAAAHGFVAGVVGLGGAGAPVAGAFLGAFVPFFVYRYVRGELAELYPPPLPRPAVVAPPLPGPPRMPGRARLPHP